MPTSGEIGNTHDNNWSLAPSGLVEASDYFNELLEHGFRETDMQFNVGRLEGAVRRGYDVVNPKTRERLYVTGESDATSERVASEVLGTHAVLSTRARSDGYNVYEVPRGSRLLVKTLQAAPYKPEYMVRLASRARAFVANTVALDAEVFGLTLSDFALTHNGEDEDDMYLTIVPPMAPSAEELMVPAVLNEFIRKKKQAQTRRYIGEIVSEASVGDIQSALENFTSRPSVRDS